VLVVEDHLVDCGIGTMVQQALWEAGSSTPVFKHGLTDFAIIGPPSHMYRYYAMDAGGVETLIVRAAERLNQPAHTRFRQPLWGDADMARVLDGQKKLDREKLRA